MFTVGQAVALGAVQGLTEFLPVSSSAHLKLVPWFMRWPVPANEQAFDVALHIGTTVALLGFFALEWFKIAMHYVGDVRQGRWAGGKTGGLLPKIALASVPAAVLGKLFEKKIDAYFYRDESHIWMLAVTMSLFGLGLVLAERFGSRKREVDTVTYRDALIVGCAQAMALIPGTSRSGITILAGLALGLTRPAAARFSFLAALPITLGAVALKSKDLRGVEDWTPLWAGIATSFVFGVIAIKVLLQYVATRPYSVFAYYRWAVAAAVIAVYLGRGPAPAAMVPALATAPAAASAVVSAAEPGPVVSKPSPATTTTTSPL